MIQYNMPKFVYILFLGFVLIPLIGIFYHISQLGDIQNSEVAKWMLYRWMKPELGLGPIELRYLARAITYFMIFFWIAISLIILFSQ